MARVDGEDTAMVTTALKMALWRRDHGGHRVGADLVHRSDADGTHPLRSRNRLCWKGLRYRSAVLVLLTTNALAESTIGLFKTEAVSKGSPFLNGPIKTTDERSALVDIQERA